MNWHYQVMKYPVVDDPEDGRIGGYGIHEYYEFEGQVSSWTETTAEIAAENPKELRKILIHMLMDLDSEGIRDYETGCLITDQGE